MKNQYVGDRSDYLKYSLLRAVRDRAKVPLEVCWMLTPNDHRPDGKDTGYLSQPAKYREVDPDLFDFLAKLVEEPDRSIADIEAGPLAGSGFESDWLSDSVDLRERYFDQVAETAPPGSLVFLDPDNGLEIASKKRGNAKSNKFLFWDEAEKLGEGRSLLIFQHWRVMVKRDLLAREMREELIARFPRHQIFALRGPKVLYLFAALPDRLQGMIRAAEQVARSWPGELALDYPGFIPEGEAHQG